eukprot:1808283-Pyramimonas_sp.AAC.1
MLSMNGQRKMADLSIRPGRLRAMKVWARRAAARTRTSEFPLGAGAAAEKVPCSSELLGAARSGQEKMRVQAALHRCFAGLQWLSNSAVLFRERRAGSARGGAGGPPAASYWGETSARVESGAQGKLEAVPEAGIAHIC